MSVPTRFFGGVQADYFLGIGMHEGNIFGNTWYVHATLGSDSNPAFTGNSPAAPLASIGAAISAGAAGDTIIIGPGTYAITAALVPKAHQVFKAAVYNPLRPSVIITGNIADLVQIDVDGTQWIGIEIKASGATADNLVDIADAAAVDGVLFRGCVFNGNGQTSVVGVQADDATFALTRLHMTNCLFEKLTGTMLDIGVLGFAYSYVGYNTFVHEANSQKGIALADTTTFIIGKAWTIEHNNFLPFDATGDEVSISIAGTENATGAGLIKNNYVAYGAAATSITQDKLSLSMVNNYTGDAATGGTLIDPGT